MMKKFVLNILLFIVCCVCNAQTISVPDTCINMKYYYSYCVVHSDTLIPSYNIYRMNNYTKDVKRNGLVFEGKSKHFNYYRSGYDKGHLVPAEDMAWSKDAIKSTFVWWNCIPQIVKLNRGTWKAEETKVRKMYGNKKYVVIVGATDYVYGIPKYCFRCVYDSFTSSIVLLSIYSNESSKKVSVSEKFKKQIMCIIHKCRP